MRKGRGGGGGGGGEGAQEERGPRGGGRGGGGGKRVRGREAERARGPRKCEGVRARGTIYTTLVRLTVTYVVTYGCRRTSVVVMRSHV